MNKELKNNIIEGIGFVLTIASIITLLCVMYELKGIQTDVKELRVTMSK